MMSSSPHFTIVLMHIQQNSFTKCCVPQKGSLPRRLSTSCLVQGLRSLLRSQSVMAALHQDPNNSKPVKSVPVSSLCTMHATSLLSGLTDEAVGASQRMPLPRMHAELHAVLPCEQSVRVVPT